MQEFDEKFTKKHCIPKSYMIMSDKIVALTAEVKKHTMVLQR